MSLNIQKKLIVINDFRHKPADCGSMEIQIAMLTVRINSLQNHFKIHNKDYHGRRGLRCIVSKRRKLLSYLKRKNTKSYVNLIECLGLRH